MVKTVNVEDDVHELLIKRSGELTAKRGHIVTLSDTIKELLNGK